MLNALASVINIFPTSGVSGLCPEACRCAPNVEYVPDDLWAFDGPSRSGPAGRSRSVARPGTPAPFPCCGRCRPEGGTEGPDRHHAPANHPEMPAGGVRLESKRPAHAAAMGHRPAASPMTAPGSAWTEAWYGCPPRTFGLGKPGVSHSRPPASSAAPTAAHRTA